MDVVILAGGLGTRLKGIWDHPKCLVLYQGRPVIELLVNKALALDPRKIFLLLGYKASEIVAWREACCPHRNVVSVIETVPEGTSSALRNVAPFITKVSKLMILNGDTIPLYDLKIIEQNYVFDGTTVVAWDSIHDCYAGCAMVSSLLGLSGLSRLRHFEGSALDRVIDNPTNIRVNVPGFLDVGTPEGFRKAQSSYDAVGNGIL